MSNIAFIYESAVRKQHQSADLVYYQNCCLDVTEVIPGVAVFGAPCSMAYSAGYCLGHAVAGDLPGSGEGELASHTTAKAATGCLPR